MCAHLYDLEPLAVQILLDSGINAAREQITSNKAFKVNTMAGPSSVMSRSRISITPGVIDIFTSLVQKYMSHF